MSITDEELLARVAGLYAGLDPAPDDLADGVLARLAVQDLETEWELLTLVERVDTIADRATGEDLRGPLRDELFEVMGCLQFQDITSQQLSYASSILFEMESRLAKLSDAFDPRLFGLTPPSRSAAPEPRRSECDQGLVDEIFGR